MTSSSSTEPARFVHSPEDARRLLGGFRAFYWAIEAVLVVGALFRPATLAAPAVVFAVTLLLWQWRAGRVPLGWTLEIDDDAIVVDAAAADLQRVARTEVAFVRFRRRRMRYASWTVLQAVGPDGTPRLEVGLRADHVDGVRAALRERGWPVDGQ